MRGFPYWPCVVYNTTEVCTLPKIQGRSAWRSCHAWCDDGWQEVPPELKKKKKVEGLKPGPNEVICLFLDSFTVSRWQNTFPDKAICNKPTCPSFFGGCMFVFILLSDRSTP